MPHVLSRRALLAGLTLAPLPAQAHADDYMNFLFAPMRGGAGAAAADRSTRTEVRLDTPMPAGSIRIDTAARRLFLILGGGRALAYDVGVGAEGFGWSGTETITAKRVWPDWRPPAEMRTRRPDLPAFVPGGPDNPMGARALYLGRTLYRIHGSNAPETVGDAASSGCFRMTNIDVIDLYDRVSIGARVTVS
ncbi:L,D-transpeptidase [Falsirhodobacter halotolerans]|uniref:L,D-transpeptidase n=1 Tax=Falsirhodobacter halotolerans TaxID=1146892 RepID=UPI001FD2790D|nr:L,D-transpeptidase [Falsirhodobacter halotolerans]MCJ8140833.1 L,D-transpeptidase [Falsirhodobacter halotolerans]